MPRRLLSLAVVLALLWPWPVALAGAEPGEVVVSLKAGTTAVTTGETFEVSIELAGLSGVIAADVQLAFDATRLQVVDADPGTKATQVTPGRLIPGLIGANQADNQSGRIRFAVATTGAGVSGSGILATVTFRAIAPGTAHISVPKRGAELLDSALAPLPYRASGVSVSIAGEPLALTEAPEAGGSRPEPETGEAGPEPEAPAPVPAARAAPALEPPLPPREPAVRDTLAVAVGPAGGVVEALDGTVRLEFPPGAVTGETEVTISTLQEPPVTASPALKPVGSAVQVEWPREALQPGAVVRLAVRYPEGLDPAVLPYLGIYQAGGTQPLNWAYVGGRINRVRGSVEAGLPGPGRYALMLYQPSFSDIQDHWAREAIELLAARRVVAGDPSGRFRPDDPVTRAEMAKLFVVALGLESGGGSGSTGPTGPGPTHPGPARPGPTRPRPTFQDVPAGAWYQPYVSAAAAQLVRGQGDRFRPEAAITRAELTVMLVRALGLEPEARGLDPATVATRLPFADTAAIPDWARPYVATAAYHGLLEGVWQEELAAGKAATRAEAAALLARAIQRLGRVETPAGLVGTLRINTIEGRHYELETAEGLYVLLLDRGNQALAARAEALVGQLVRVTGRPFNGVTIYQRGRAFEVFSIEAVQP